MADQQYQLSGHAARRIAKRKIKEEWIAAAFLAPDRTEPDRLDSTAQHVLKRIEEMDNRVLRVVYNVTIQPPRVISVYFDRRMKGKL